MTPPSTRLRALFRRVSMLLAGTLLIPAGAAVSQSLQGSPASLDRQNNQARAHGFTFIQTPQQLRSFVENGYLVPVVPNRDFDIHQVSFPYTRPEVRVFIERLAAQYRSACGEKLVVTSLTRPISNQPSNASVRSVHPTGMAVDLRRSANARCRQWLESTLLSLEAEGLLEAIYERNPPHYHVAVYPQPYAQYVASVTGSTTLVAQSIDNGAATELRMVTHRVTRGETLSGIATRYGTSVARVRAENGMQGDRLLVGQELRIPVYQTAQAPQVAAAAPPAQPAAQPASVAMAAVAAPAPVQNSSVQTAAAPVSASAVHVVARGESLWTISRRYGVSEDQLRRANGLTGSRILVGQRLSVPAGGSGPPSVEVRHTVASGESLWIIARAYGVTEDLLRAANGIQGSTIHAGQTLTVPANGTGSSTLQYTVQRGDSLWVIANRLGTSVDRIRASNGMASTRIYAGQVLDVPLTR